MSVLGRDCILLIDKNIVLLHRRKEQIFSCSSVLVSIYVFEMVIFGTHVLIQFRKYCISGMKLVSENTL